MADTKLAALKVSADMDARGFAAGANEIDASAKKAGAAAKSLGDAISSTERRLRPASDGLERLKRQFIDGYGAQQNFERALGQISRALDRGALTAEQAEKALIGLNRTYGLTADSALLAARGQTVLAAAADRVNTIIARQPTVMRSANDNMAQYRRQNLGMQLFDVGQSAALGMPLGMIAMQQGPQIAQLYAAQGGLNAAMRDFGVILAGVARVAGPVIAVMGGLYGAYRILESNSVAAGLAISDSTRALAEQAAPLGSLKGMVTELEQVQTAYNKALAESALSANAATSLILANSEKEYNARKRLLELELQLQEAKIATQQADMALLGQSMRERVSSQVASDPSAAVREGFADPRINGGIPFVRLNEELDTLDKTLKALDADPAKTEIDTMRAKIEIARIEVEKFREALKPPFDAGGDPLGDSYWSRFSAAQLAKEQAYRDMENPVPSFPNGVPVPQQRPIDGDDENATLQKKIDLLRQEAGARRDIAGLITQKQSFLQTQQDDIEKLRLEAQLVGESAQTRARAMAALEAEQRIRQQGIQLTQREAEAYKANAVAMADVRLQIERSQAAYTSYQQAGSSAIDALTASTGSLSDRLKGAADAMLSWITQLALANPLKNALFGTNLPTLADLGKPQVPGLSATSTGTMTVTAGVVNVAGGAFPGIPGTAPGSSTGGLLDIIGGKVPAQANPSQPFSSSVDAVNALRQTNTSPIVNSASRVDLWRQSISKIESGSYAGNYNAIGPVTRSGDQAYGRYQVMGNNVPSWSEKWYGERLTPSEFLANKSAQDAVFDGEFGSYVSKYGEGPAATKWFTGSHIAKGRSDGFTVDHDYQSQFESNMRKLSTTSATASKDIGTLGDSSAKVSTSLADISKIAAPAATPAVPAVTPTTPTSSGGGFLGLFGGFFKLLGFADGTDFAPGGVAMVGERGPELINVPRGSQVTPTHKLQGPNSEERMRGRVVRHNYSIQISGLGDRDLLEKMRKAADESVAIGIRTYNDHVMPGRVQEVAENPYDVG